MKLAVELALMAMLGMVFSTAAFAEFNDIQIENFRQITPGIYAGANPIDREVGEDALTGLFRLGVKIDIDLQGADLRDAPNELMASWYEANEPGERPEMIKREQTLVRNQGLNFVSLPLNSSHVVDREEGVLIDQALEILALATPTNPVFIHCEHGADRTGLVIALFRVLYQHKPIDEANAEWVEFGHTWSSRLLTGELDEYFCSRVARLGPSSACP
jgi:protein tyrosine/serine phosphatase